MLTYNMLAERRDTNNVLRPLPQSFSSLNITNVMKSKSEQIDSCHGKLNYTARRNCEAMKIEDKENKVPDSGTEEHMLPIHTLTIDPGCHFSQPLDSHRRPSTRCVSPAASSCRSISVDNILTQLYDAQTTLRNTFAAVNSKHLRRKVPPRSYSLNNHSEPSDCETNSQRNEEYLTQLQTLEKKFKDFIAKKEGKQDKLEIRINDIDEQLRSLIEKIETMVRHRKLQWQPFIPY